MQCLLISFLLLLGHPASGTPQVPAVAVVHATVVPMDGERQLLGHTILVRDGRITWWGPDEEAEMPEGTRVIDAGGGWVLPGLTDMHVHAGVGDLPLFVSNGVTTVREMNGTPQHLEWRQAASAGEGMGPSWIVSGPLISGEEQRWRHVIARTPQEARALVRDQSRVGFDEIKVYDGLSRETYDALVESADGLGIPFVGHVPREVGLERVIEARQRSIEHVGQIAHALPSVEPAALSEVAARIAKAGVWVTPTLASEEALTYRGTAWYAERLARPEAAAVDPGLLEWWCSLGKAAPDAATAARRDAYRQGIQDLVVALHDAGVPLLAGTDTPNPLMVPGFSLHEELAALVEAGLSPYAAIRSATAEPARFAGREGEFGTIRVGARADLVLVHDDPLADVGVLRRPAGVMLRGEWLTRERLDAILAEALGRPGGSR